MSTIKKKATRGKDQFGAAHSTTPLLVPAPMGSDTKGNNTPMGLAALGGNFYNLAVVATNKQAVLKDLVTKLTTLTTSNTDMAAMIKKLTGENQQL